MQKRSIIDIWQGFRYGSAASFFNWFPLSLFGYLNEYINILFFFCESVQLLWPRDVNQEYFKIFHWFPNHLLHINDGNINFSYIYPIKMRKSSLWKISRWNARLIYTINENNNKSYNKNQDRIIKAFQNFLLNKTILSNKQSKYFFFMHFFIHDIASFNFFKFSWLEQSINILKFKASALKCFCFCFLLFPEL